MTSDFSVKQCLERLFSQQLLTGDEAEQLLEALATSSCSAAQQAAVLAVYRMRSPTVAELQGFRRALLRLCVPVDTAGLAVVDLCGTGGDAKNTFNISTLASLVVAGAGVPVAKHGNYGASSACGASNLLEELGLRFSADPALLRRSLHEAGICFLHAPLFHPALKNVAAVRKELGVKTFFNILGPLVNPARPAAQFCGVFSPQMQRLYTYILEEGESQFMVVHSFDGYDEVSLTGSFRTITRCEQRIWEPEDLGLPRLHPEQLQGGADAAAAARIALDILEGRGTAAQQSVVLINAALAMTCVEPDCALPTALGRARESLESGRARAVLAQVVDIMSSHG